MRNFLERRDLVEEVISGTFFFVGMLIILYSVIMRYFFNDAPIWADEVSVYFIICGTIFGWSIALKDDRHIRVAILYDRLSLRKQRVMFIVSTIIGLGFSIFLIVGASVLEYHYYTSMLRSINMAYPLWIVNIFFPIASTLLALRFTEQLQFALKNGGTEWFDAHQQEKKG